MVGVENLGLACFQLCCARGKVPIASRVNVIVNYEGWCTIHAFAFGSTGAK